MKSLHLSVLRTARMIWWGVILQGSLFAMWGVNLFLTADEVTTTALWPYFVFAALAVLSLVYGSRFYPMVSHLRRGEILAYDLKKRKESLLLITVIHLLLLEFVCVLGIFLAIFLQSKTVVYPFFFVSMIALVFSFPKEDWYQSFFKETDSI